jgi:hypothetical protein
MTPEEIEALADAAAAALQLNIASEHRPGVLRYLALAASHAELVNALPLTPADEPASAFTPVSPPAAEGASE